MQVITYGPSKMGYDVETDETYFTTELLVDGVNSGMFINRDLYSILKQFYSSCKTPAEHSTFKTYMNTVIHNMVGTALFEVETDVIAEFLATEIKNAK